MTDALNPRRCEVTETARGFGWYGAPSVSCILATAADERVIDVDSLANKLELPLEHKVAIMRFDVDAARASDVDLVRELAGLLNTELAVV